MSESSAIRWVRPHPFVYCLTVERSAIDSYQHVNNSVYLRWADDCARAHSTEIGINPEQAVELGLGMAVREVRATYCAAAHEGDAIQVGTWIVRNDGKLRMTREFQIIRERDGATLVRADVDYVCINIHTGRAVKMPKHFKQLYVACAS